jgi:proton glutamate symport protein
VAQTGFAAFGPLLRYALTVLLGLIFHACVTLPLILRVVARVNPWWQARAMASALFTAFSTASSSITLPITMECVQDRAGVSPKITGFVLPLGATVNMDGTALYECVATIFLAQYYASQGLFELTLVKQILVVITALLASIGAAGIPMAGLVMMTVILKTIGLPLEGIAYILAVDRILDMCRTTVNVWSDSCGAVTIAHLEGERPLGTPPP